MQLIGQRLRWQPYGRVRRQNSAATDERSGKIASATWPNASIEADTDSAVHQMLITTPTAWEPRTYPFSTFATSRAKYVSTPSAPARLKAMSASSITFSRSSQPRSAAPASIAYSPDT